ncbi:bifunctional proline dehydrogenase/L-glutamate gamma-semialdehyde dehydrogenase PutA [Tropicimonas sp. IMCC6043]|uniref:bifunctional proline dehydrogenase/L-glutamate gamma-semialdehyde dehydrogenase PutA n=1 Tax=Tropicimonas sp. IMCC6043 TaxID=2510645 RepID=UPI00101BCEDE|nr:bifunctional proline dehydrogenase/L-glutamate gamma-semialdehyde dehydrogenase PutA [Tropicimonas sp. IMCC6043]RYH12169.1 bifunctional proline dehydrogenase/L-glutamate gamma-semialdehyde dehydrogenase PutA [Tropicimonas sp. IMCC6043]
MITTLDTARARLHALTHPDEPTRLAELTALAALSDADRAAISARGAALVEAIRGSDDPGLMEMFLAQYGLSTDEGIALMCLAEALLRVPDAATIDALIEDKIAPSDWSAHLRKSASYLVNASTWGLLLTGRVLKSDHPGLAGTLRGAVRRLGEPVIRSAVGQAMKQMGNQFVLGESIGAALKRAAKMEEKGYSYSYDMLGEAARTEADALRYHRAYLDAVSAIAPAARRGGIRENPGVSVKLSALHPRFEVSQRGRVMDELVPRVRDLALACKHAGMGLNIDAEEADRLEITLDVFEAVARDKRLAGWDGFGTVVQAYGPRADAALDWIHALAETLDRRFTVRLVKGAYWDSEIKRAQVLGLEGFPVFTRKPITDVSYIACARRLLGMTDRIYPQFATHNAHSAEAILHMAEDRQSFEFQRLHGMGERLHQIVKDREGTRCRIYAPVGAHRDLLAYLVRRLLENGANSSFVNQIVDEAVPAAEVARDPIAEAEAALTRPTPVVRPADLFGADRRNARGWDLTDADDLAEIEAARAPFRTKRFSEGPIIAGQTHVGDGRPVVNPADPADIVGHVTEASPAQVEAALAAADPWTAEPFERAATLRRAASLYEENFGLFFALAAREAGKSLPDCVGELREAVDFLRYYASRIEHLDRPARGTFACISPWNFPLAIFTGQIAAALAAGNAVFAKPAEQTPLIAAAAVHLLHEAGVPATALQLLPGTGETVGAALTSEPRVDGVCFTGGTDTAQIIHRSMAESLAPDAPLIAETGGLNAMVVDSTALPEQAVRDILASAFQSAGQRCSALRCLYVQEDIAEGLLDMLKGAMQCLSLGMPWDLSTDVGPVIDEDARRVIDAHVAKAEAEGRLIFRLDAPAEGLFCAPALIRISGIADLEREVFGPVLHVATFKAAELGRVIDAINATGYGLTFGLHSRIDDRVQSVVDRVAAGNLYVNRNQIGAIVGSQPFGGEGLSGTGPKAGGPAYLPHFTAPAGPDAPAEPFAEATTAAAVQSQIDAANRSDTPIEQIDMPGPTGELNRLTTLPRAPVLCLGPGAECAAAQADLVRAAGATPIPLDADLPPAALDGLEGFGAVLWWGDAETARALRRALAGRPGPILPLLTGLAPASAFQLERHLCVDTTASGGNAALLAAVSQ